MVEPTEAETRMATALRALGAPVPSTKGMDPKARAQRLHAELERRIRIARDALHPPPPEATDA